MRVVWGSSELAEAIVGARREAEAAFGDGTVFLERYLRDPRHIEVQVVADAYGDTVALFERECSIQRRHQKIIEEAPSPAVTPAAPGPPDGGGGDRRPSRWATSTPAPSSSWSTADGEPFFLEMNTRLQVEHPVTEAITGLDLVRLQLLIAGGAPMPAEVHAAVGGRPSGPRHRGPALRRGPGPGMDAVDRGAAPVRAGDIGTAGRGAVRVDSGVETGSTVSPHYDPMLAKVIAHAPTRPEAAASLASTLARSRIHGPVTNRDLLVRVLRHPAFLAGNTDTGFLDRHGIDQLAAPLADLDALRRHALAAALAGQARRRAEAGVQRTHPLGLPQQRVGPADHRPTTWPTGWTERWWSVTGSTGSGAGSTR